MNSLAFFRGISSCTQTLCFKDFCRYSSLDRWKHAQNDYLRITRDGEALVLEL